MAKHMAVSEEPQKVQIRKARRPEEHRPSADSGMMPHEAGTPAEASILALHNQIGNAAVQRMLAQRSGSGPTELDDQTASRINSARGSGQALDSTVQKQMGSAMGQDFSGVRVHTSRESDQLNQELSAKAFTTGQDIFFRNGAYSPNTGSGQELIAHELTHVVQQGSGQVGSVGRMTVNDPGDQFEQEADAVAKAVGNAEAPAVQRQEIEEDELQTKRLQRQEAEEEDKLQMQEMEEDELQAAAAVPEEEEMPQ